jgi:hypothetical protein
MRSLLLSMLLSGMALVGLERYVEYRTLAANPQHDAVLPAGGAASGGAVHSLDGGNGMPPCCH